MGWVSKQVSLLEVLVVVAVLIIQAGCGGGGSRNSGGGGAGGNGGGNDSPSVTLTVDPSSIRAGQSAVLRWTSSNATSLSIDGFGSVTVPGDHRTVCPSATTTYRITATGSGNRTATASATLTVSGLTDIRALNHIIFLLQENRSLDHYFGHLNTYRQAKGWGNAGDVETIDSLTTAPVNAADDRADLRWSTSNAQSVTLNGTAVNTSGSMTVNPSTATKYTLVASGIVGPPATASVVVGVTPDAGSSIIGASPETIAPGGTAMLSWASNDYQSGVTVTPPPDPAHPLAYGPHARVPVRPTATTTYTLTSRSGSAAVTVNVAAPVTGAPTASIDDNNQGHLSTGSFVNVASFRLGQGADQCTEDFSPDWLESHGAFNRDNPGSSTWRGDGFVHIAAGFAQYANSQGGPFHYWDVRGARAMSYFDENILPYYYYMAGQFAIADHFFSPVPSNSPPNRLYSLGATSRGMVHARNQSLDSSLAPPIFKLLDDKGISWKVYYSDVSTTGNHEPNTTLLNFQPYGSLRRDRDHLAPVDCHRPNTPCAADQTDYLTDVTTGNLAQVVYIEPGFDSGLDEHPGNWVQPGAAYVESIINTLMYSQSWKDSVFILTYDEAGGLYDHVRPMAAVPPDDILPSPQSAGGDLITHFDGTRWTDKDAFTMCSATDPNSRACVGFDRTGFRVPAIVVSPFSKMHYVAKTPMDYTAILKLIETRFGLPNLTQRDRVQPDMTEFFDFVNPPWSTPPPRNEVPLQPTNAPCFVQRLY